MSLNECIECRMRLPAVIIYSNLNILIVDDVDWNLYLKKELDSLIAFKLSYTENKCFSYVMNTKNRFKGKIR